jgi:hypothetical protein
MDLYTIRPNKRFPNKWDVIRTSPTIVSSELKQVEAEALAFALNQQVKQLEGAK